MNLLEELDPVWIGVRFGSTTKYNLNLSNSIMPYSAELKEVCGCGMSMQGNSKDELVSRVKGHALDMHGIKEVPPELADKLGRAIHES